MDPHGKVKCDPPMVLFFAHFCCLRRSRRQGPNSEREGGGGVKPFSFHFSRRRTETLSLLPFLSSPTFLLIHTHCPDTHTGPSSPPPPIRPYAPVSSTWVGLSVSRGKRQEPKKKEEGEEEAPFPGQVIPPLSCPPIPPILSSPPWSRLLLRRTHLAC